MFEFLIISFLITFVIILLLISGVKNKRQAIETYSIPTFMGSSSYKLVDEELVEQKKSLMETVNDFFDGDDSGDADIDDGGGDAGE